MPSRRGLPLTGFAAVLVSACTLLAPPDPRLCGAAQSLSAATTLMATALQADQGGDIARAQGLAVQARSLAEAANATLKQVPAERQSDPTWQALLSAYGQVGQAANALLPAFGYDPDMARPSLASAQAAMGKARPGLPSMCFDLPADLETPRAS